MINKLLDEPYWDEMEQELTPFITHALEKNLFFDEEDNEGLDAAIMFIEDVLSEAYVTEVHTKHLYYINRSQVLNLIPVIKENLLDLKEVLLDSLIRKVYQNTKEELALETSLTRVEIKERCDASVKEMFNELYLEPNIQVLVRKYKEVFRD